MSVLVVGYERLKIPYVTVHVYDTLRNLHERREKRVSEYPASSEIWHLLCIMFSVPT